MKSLEAVRTANSQTMAHFEKKKVFYSVFPRCSKKPTWKIQMREKKIKDTCYTVPALFHSIQSHQRHSYKDGDWLVRTHSLSMLQWAKHTFLTVRNVLLLQRTGGSKKDMCV